MHVHKSLLLFSLLSLPLWRAPAQEARPDLHDSDAVTRPDFSKTVLPIHELKFHLGNFEIDYGTGFCLDSECRFVVTNYHVGQLANPARIAGHKIIVRQSATGPSDEDATMVRLSYGPPMRFNYSRDLALFELETPLASNAGAGFITDELQLGQEVEIYVYPLERKFHTPKLIRFVGRFNGMTDQGLLAFDYDSSAGHRIGPGSSGGIVVDSRSQKIVGVVSAIAADGALMTFAVPVQTLADFVYKVQPDLAQRIFAPSLSTRSEVAPDLYAQPEPVKIHSLQHRTDESPAVKLLRKQAQGLAESMQNFIARQYVEWGMGDRKPSVFAAYEIRVLDGNVRFREYPDGEKTLPDLPFPPLNTAIVTGGEWSELPRLVAWEPHLRVEQMPDAIIDGRRFKIFRYRGDVEDAVCRFRSSFDFGFFEVKKDAVVACYGEVWTDENTNILRMSEHYDLPGSWRKYQAVMSYDWLLRPGEAPRLIPISISAHAEHRGKIYWCRSQFFHYQVFTSTVTMTMK